MENTAVSPPILSPPRYPGPISQSMIAEMQRYVIYHPWPFLVDLAGCDGL